MKLVELPLYSSLSKTKLNSLLSFDGMIKKIKKTKSLVFSFIGDADADDESFRKHFASTGEIFKTMSCIPGKRRMNLKVSISLFDAFETMKFGEFLNLIKSLCSKTISISMHDEWNVDLPVLLAVSKKLKTILICMTNSSSNWLLVDEDTSNNQLFNSSSLGYTLSRYFGGCYLGNSTEVWRPASLRNEDNCFRWHVGNKSLIDNRIFYNSLTAGYHRGPFKIDMPVVSSIADLKLVQPAVELMRLQHRIDDANDTLDKAKVALKESENLVEKVLMDFDVNLGT